MEEVRCGEGALIDVLFQNKEVDWKRGHGSTCSHCGLGWQGTWGVKIGGGVYRFVERANRAQAVAGRGGGGAHCAESVVGVAGGLLETWSDKRGDIRGKFKQAE